jgi:hypothetical protein
LKSSLICFFWIAFVLVACSGQATPTIYIPAEQVNFPVANTPTAIATEVVDQAQDSRIPTTSPECTSSLLFLQDITIPDGTRVQPEESLDKRWLVENNGTCNWDRRFSLRLIAGLDMGVDQDLALFPARSGSQVEIQIRFTAPQEIGLHRSAWQAVDPGGNLFGDTIFIEIEVSNP